MTNTLYCVTWKRKNTDGPICQGQPSDYKTVEAWVDELNKEWPDFQHWAEPPVEEFQKNAARQSGEAFNL